MDIAVLEKVVKVFEASSLSHLKVETEDIKIELEKTTVANTVVSSVAPASVPGAPVAPAAPAPQQALGTPVKAPLVGVFYLSPGPGEKPFVEVGQQVQKGDTLCIIEAMKMMNEVPSPITGVVKSVLVENEDIVSFDQVLMEIEESNV